MIQQAVQPTTSHPPSISLTDRSERHENMTVACFIAETLHETRDERRAQQQVAEFLTIAFGNDSERRGARFGMYPQWAKDEAIRLMKSPPRGVYMGHDDCEHDPTVCGCRHVGFGLWSCGYNDQH